MTASNRPYESFVGYVERYCGSADSPNLGNRAKLRRALRATQGNMATFEALSVIGGALNDRDSARRIEIKAGIAALYAAHGQPLRSQPWVGPAQVLREAKASGKISDNRAGRDLLGILRDRDPSGLIRRCHRALSLCEKTAKVDVARTDWGLLLADLIALTSEDPDERLRVEKRWARDFARIPAPDGKAELESGVEAEATKIPREPNSLG